MTVLHRYRIDPEINMIALKIGHLGVRNPPSGSEISVRYSSFSPAHLLEVDTLSCCWLADQLSCTFRDEKGQV